MVPKVRLRSKPASLGDSTGRVVGGLQQLARSLNALRQEPLQRSESGRRAESPDQRARSHALPFRQVLNRKRLVEVFERPVQQRRQAVVLVARQRHLDILRLTPGPMRSNDQPSRKIVGDLRSEIESNHVEAQVQTGSQPGAGQYISFVNVQDGRVNPDPWIELGQ